jgi:uncharacterized protein (TIGR03435 family)
MTRCTEPAFASDRRSRILRVGLIMLAGVGAATSQAATIDGPIFEVASVKPAASASGRFTMSGGPGTSDPGRISYTNIMLRRVLLSAFDVKSYQILGPDWLDTLRFDITAKVPDGANGEQFQSTLRNLLVTRFKMTIHRESKELPIYALLAAKNGAKVRAVANGGAAAGNPPEDQLAMIQAVEGRDGFPALALPPGSLVIETKNGRARVTAKEAPISKLADLLSGQLGCPVVDMTGWRGPTVSLSISHRRTKTPTVVPTPISSAHSRSNLVSSLKHAKAR